MKIIDISWPLSENMTGYKDKSTLEIITTRFFNEDGVRESKISCGVHVGTHVDAPSHMLEDGSTIERIELKNLIGEAILVDLTYAELVITKEDLINFNLPPNIILLLKTKNSDLLPTQNFNKDFVYLNDQAAQYCIDMKVKAIGIDYLGIERDQSDHLSHKKLFSNNVAIIEGLRFKNISEGKYFFICLPLKLSNIDAAPARAILLENLPL